MSPKSGIVIDCGPVSNQLWDFYLISCNAPKGKVANPVRVIVIIVFFI